MYGNPRSFPFDHWVNQSPNIVIVSVYYRLSSFGFLATPAFRDTVNGDFNAGFLDQLQALKWVKEHIRSFGGNPEKVTINGQSAGGSSVELHLVANEGERLFSQAIAQSVYRSPVPTPKQQEVRAHYNLGSFKKSSIVWNSLCLISTQTMRDVVPGPWLHSWHVCGKPVSVHSLELRMLLSRLRCK